MSTAAAIAATEQTTIAKVPTDLAEALGLFLRYLGGQNRSEATIGAYRADLTQFLEWLEANNLAARRVDQVERADVSEFLSFLGARRISGVTRARKLAVIREYFRFLIKHEYLGRSPAEGVDTPKREQQAGTWLIPGEYRAMLAAAGANPRNYAVLQVFLQTGIRVSELVELRLDDVDLHSRALLVRHGKGMVARTVELEKKALEAVKSWLKVRPDSLYDHLFLNQYGEPISTRGVQKLVTKYRRQAGITTWAGCHSLRHTFGTLKAEQGVSPFQLKEGLGHARLDTTQIYVHLSRQDAKKVMEATSL